MGNIQHLAQLAGDARAVATSTVTRFPFVVIVSSRRDLQAQAIAMASNCVHQRDWILGDAHAEPPVKATYRWSKAAMLCHDWSVHHLEAKEHELAAAFAHLLNQLPVSELCKLSAHLAPVTAGAEAFDISPRNLVTAKGLEQLDAGELSPEWSAEGIEVLAHLEAEAIRLGGTFLRVESKRVVLHWQAKRR